MKRFMIFALCASLSSASLFAQQKKLPIVRLGEVIQKDAEKSATGTLQQVLANPRLTVPGTNIRIREFSVSWKAKGKEYTGPFPVMGNELTPPIIEKLKKLENPEGMIYVESIKGVDENNTETTFSPIIMKLVANTK